VGGEMGDVRCGRCAWCCVGVRWEMWEKGDVGGEMGEGRRELWVVRWEM
jgi:hypothetical protein